MRTAEDTSLRREVAVKTLLDPRGSDLAAFIEEAQITGQLEHPNIVPLHELGFDPEGRPYIAMKRVQGRTLRAAISQSHKRKHTIEAGLAADERQLLEVFNKTCDAVGYAHSRGVIHRDLKPDNVMVGEFGEVLVMDWGLARPVDRDDRDVAPSTHSSKVTSSRRERVAADSSELTMEGEVFGTPVYMPPEQAEGRIGEMGVRSDIYMPDRCR